MVLIVALITNLLVTLGFHANAVCTDLKPRVVDRDNYTIYVVTIPHGSQYRIVPAVSDQLELLPNMVNKVGGNVAAAINAGFFDPNNKKTTSYVTTQKQLI